MKKCNIFKPHKWGKWEDKGQGDLTYGGVRIGTYYVQEKRCEKCNKLKVKKIKI